MSSKGVIVIPSKCEDIRFVIIVNQSRIWSLLFYACCGSWRRIHSWIIYSYSETGSLEIDVFVYLRTQYRFNVFCFIVQGLNYALSALVDIHQLKKLLYVYGCWFGFFLVVSFFFFFLSQLLCHNLLIVLIKHKTATAHQNKIPLRPMCTK